MSRNMQASKGSDTCGAKNAAYPKGTVCRQAMQTRRLQIILCMLICFNAIHSTGAQANIEGSDAELTPLQKHVGFFDRNKDGIIYPTETYRGFRALGASVTLSLVSAAFINGLLGPKTRKGKIPSPYLPIYIENIKKGMHGSDSGVYDSEGRFVPSKFEEIFVKHAKTHPNALTYDELKEMLKANQEPNDQKGWLAASTEWNALYMLFKDKDGLLQKDTIRDVYDGTLFYNKEKERKSSAKKA